jgi:hypothetical protein
MRAEFRPVRVGVVDSGINPGIDRAAPALLPTVLAARAFVRSPEGQVQRVAPCDDGLGHGSAVAALIADGAGQCVEFVDAQVFPAAQAIDAGLLADAIDWCVGHSVRVLNLSLGLHADRTLLRDACARASAAGVTLVAACPARGGSTFPAAYPQVIAVSGDARCLAGGWSVLSDRPHFGASPCALPPAAGGGASYAAARVSGFAAAFFAAQPTAGYADLLAHLRAGAGFVGRECRS